MSVVESGTVTITTTQPSVGKSITEIGSADAILYWATSTSLNLQYQTSSNWSTTLSGPTTIPVSSASLIGPPRNLLDFSSNGRWAVWPHVNDDENLQITMVLVNGDATTTTSANYLYSGVFGATETVTQIGVMTDGVATLVRDDDGTQSIRFFTYPISSFGSITVDAVTSNNPVVSNYTHTFASTTLARFTRDRIFTMNLDGSQMRNHFIDVSVEGDTVTYTTMINSYSGLPSDADAVYWLGSLSGTNGATVTIYPNSSGLNALLTRTNGTSPSSVSLGITGTVNGTKKLLPFTSSQAYLFIKEKNYAAKLDLTNFNLLSSDTFITLDDAVTVIFDSSVPVVTGVDTTTSVLGTNAGAIQGFGSLETLGTGSQTFNRVFSKQGIQLGTTLVAETQWNGETQSLVQYTVANAPPSAAYTPVTGSFARSDLYKNTLVTGLKVLQDGSIASFGISVTKGLFNYNISTDTLTTIDTSVGTVTGNSALAPNGDLFWVGEFSGESTLFRSANGNSAAEQVVSLGHSGTGSVVLFPNGLFVTLSGPYATPVVQTYRDGTLTTLSGISLTEGTYNTLDILSNGTLLTCEFTGTFSIMSMEGSGSVLSDFTLPGVSSVFTSSQHEVDKFYFSSNSYPVVTTDVDVSNQTSATVDFTGTPLSQCFGSTLAPNGYFYQGGNSNKVYVSIPS